MKSPPPTQHMKIQVKISWVGQSTSDHYVEDRELYNFIDFMLEWQDKTSVANGADASVSPNFLSTFSDYLILEQNQ